MNKATRSLQGVQDDTYLILTTRRAVLEAGIHVTSGLSSSLNGIWSKSENHKQMFLWIIVVHKILRNLNSTGNFKPVVPQGKTFSSLKHFAPWEKWLRILCTIQVLGTSDSESSSLGNL